MKKILLSFILTGFIPLSFAQTVELPETVISINYKYLETIETHDAAPCVKELKKEVLNYKHSNIADLYDDEYDTYKVSFYIPKGKIIAAYNSKGEIVRTIEKYNNVKLPLVVMQSISKRFPNWSIVEDIYLVKYHSDKSSLKQEYKVKIKNSDKIITVKTDEKGVFI